MKCLNHYLSSSLFWLLCIVGFGLIGGQDTPEAYALPVARLESQQPTVTVLHRGAARVAFMREGGALAVGDIVRTNATGKAHLIFSNGTRMILGPNSSLEIRALETPSTPLITRLFGALSTLWIKPRGKTAINTRAANAGARGTEFVVRLLDEDTTQVTVTEGAVEFYNASATVMVKAQYQSTAHVGQPPQPPVLTDVTGLLQWAADITALPVEFENRFTSLTPSRLAASLHQAELAVQADPTNTDLHRRLGEIYYDSGAYASAAVQFNEAARLSPSRLTLMALGRAKLAQGDAPGAIAAYQQAQGVTPLPSPTQVSVSDDSVLRAHLALAYLAQQDLAQARTTLEVLPQSPVAQAVLGLLDLQQGQSSQAMRELEAAVALDPDLYQAYALLALAHLTQNQIPDALQTARQAVELQPNSAQAQGTLAMVYFFAGRSEEAYRAGKQAVKLNPLSPLALLTQGRILLSQLRVDEARQALQQAQALSPNLPVIPNELGAVYLRLDMPLKAEQAYRQAIALNSNAADAHTGLGEAFYLQGQSAAAKAEYEGALSLKPDNSSARAHLAELYIRAGKLKEAQAELKTGLQYTPKRGLLLALSSEASLLAQDPFEARNLARQAVEAMPDAALAHYQLGRVYLELNSLVQAQEEFRRAIILDSRFTDARYALGYTQQLASTSPNYSLPFPNNVAALGGAASALNLQNLAGPGRDNLVQAAIQNPSVIRSASRSYGDNQANELTGTDGQHTLEVSHLAENASQRDVEAITLQNGRNSGRFNNSDTETQGLSAIFGHKAQNSPSSFLLLTQYENFQEGLNTGDTPFTANASNRVHKPLLILGGNYQHGEGSRTQSLIQLSAPQSSATGFTNNGLLTSRVHSLNAELRHDWQISARQLITGGLATGVRTDNDDTFLGGIAGQRPDFHLLTSVDIHMTEAYMRDEMKVSPRLTVMGEMKFQQIHVASATQGIIGPPISVSDEHKDDDWLPTAIAAYRVNSRSEVRLRARRLQGNVRDFELLYPQDVFLTSLDDLPLLNIIQGHGRSIELEGSHTFANASLLRVELFDERFANAKEPSVEGSGVNLPHVHSMGVRAGYEGFIRRNITYFTNLNVNSSRDVEFKQYVANVPRWTTEIGLQYLNRQGWFVQPAFYYQGARIKARDDLTRLGGFGLLNLRLGKQVGLHSVLFAEVSDLNNKSYELYNVLQPGRRFHFGLAQRF